MGNEWALVFFTSFVALGCGTFMGVTVSEWRGTVTQIRTPGAVLALIALILGGGSSVLHLQHPERIFGALGHPTSGIFTEAALIGLAGVIIFMYLVTIYKGSPQNTRKKLTLTGSVLALLLSFAVGDTYVMSSRPAWDTLALPFVYLGSALVMGSLSVRMLVTFSNSDQKALNLLSLSTYLSLGLQALFILAYLVAVAGADYADPSRSATRIVAGNLAPLFWGGVVILGLGVPAISTRMKLTKGNAMMGLLAAFIGTVCFRLMMFHVGTSIWDFFSF